MGPTDSDQLDQKGGSPTICSHTDRWGTRQDGQVLEGLTFSLPGTGKITDSEQCGSWVKVAACSTDPGHYKKPIAHNCGHIDCPICWSGPVGKASKRVSSRLRGYQRAALVAGLKTDIELTINHFVLSPPDGAIVPGMTNNQVKQKGRDIAMKAGIWGGVMAFHPWRIKKAVSWRLKLLCTDNLTDHPEEREKKYWELIRENALGLSSWIEYVTWSPHFHVIGFGKLPDQKTPEERENVSQLYKGWVVVWIRHVNDYRQFDGTSLDDPISDLAFYIFSHAGYQQGRKIPVLLGVISPNNLYVVTVEKQEYQVSCPKCQAPVWMGAEDPGGIFVPDLVDGRPVRYLLRCKAYVYGIGKNPNSTAVFKKSWAAQCEKARLERLSWGIT